MTSQSPHQWIKPRNHDASARCRICCQNEADANPVCHLVPGNPDRPFMFPETLNSLMSDRPAPAGPAIASAPTDNAPVHLHIMRILAQATAWRRPLAGCCSRPAAGRQKAEHSSTMATTEPAIPP